MFNKRILSIILVFCMISAIFEGVPAAVNAEEPPAGSGPAVSLTDVDADRVYFSGDTLSFNMSGLALPDGQSIRVAFGVAGESNTFTPAALIDGLTSGDGVQHYVTEEVYGGGFGEDISGLIQAGLDPGIAAVELYLDADGAGPGNTWINVLQGRPVTHIMLNDAGLPAFVGFDDALAMPAEVTGNPVPGTGAQADENLYSMDITFQKVIDTGIKGSIYFSGLDLIDNKEHLQGLSAGLIMQKEIDPGEGNLEKYTMGVDVSTLAFLGNIGATVSVTSPSFDGLTEAYFVAEAVGSGDGTVGGLFFDDDTDTVSFTVNHFSNYSLSLKNNADKNGDGYHDGDAAALKAFMDQPSRDSGSKNGQMIDMFYNSGMRMNYFDNSQANGANCGITWSGTPKRITKIEWTSLLVRPRRLAGVFDARPLSELTRLEIFNGGSLYDFKAVTDVKAAGLSKLKELIVVNAYENNDPQLTGLACPIDLTGVAALETLNLYGSYSSFPGVNLTPCENLAALDLSRCGISSMNSITGFEELTKLTSLGLYGNRLKLSQLPLPKQQWTTYTTEYQRFPAALTGGDTVDLSSETMIDGVPTTFTWLNVFSSQPVTSGIINNGGVFTFDPSVNPDLDDMTLSCKVENTKFPPRSGWEVYFNSSENITLDFISVSGIVDEFAAGNAVIEDAAAELVNADKFPLSPARTTITDAEGKYKLSLTGLAAANDYYVKASKTGYADCYAGPFKPVADIITSPRLKLPAAAPAAGDITVARTSAAEVTVTYNQPVHTGDIMNIYGTAAGGNPIGSATASTGAGSIEAAGVPVGSGIGTIYVTFIDGSDYGESLPRTEVSIPTYGASIDPSGDYTFPKLIVDYGADSQKSQTFTITFTGTAALTNISAVLSGANADKFAISELTAIDSIHRTFTVKAIDGLPTNTYNAIVTVTADYISPIIFSLTQQVAEIPVLPDITGMTVSGTTVSWPPVANAAGYIVDIRKDGTTIQGLGAVEITGTGINLALLPGDTKQTLTGGNNYSIRVMTKGDGINYLNSKGWVDLSSFTPSAVTLPPLPYEKVITDINACSDAGAVRTYIDITGNRNKFGANEKYVNIYESFTAEEKTSVAAVVWNSGSDYALNPDGEAALITAYESACKQVFIERARAIVGTSFIAVEFVDTNILTSLNRLAGMSATGVILSLAAKEPADTMPITLANGEITYNSSEHTGSVTLSLEYDGKTDTHIITAVKIPEKDTIAPVPGGDPAGKITAASVGQNSLVLNWVKAVDNRAAQNQLKYFIIKSSSDNISDISGMEGNGTLLNEGGTFDIGTYAVTGLLPSTKYYFNIAVKDLGRNYAAYTAVGVTTAAVPSGGGSKEDDKGSGGSSAAIIPATAPAPAPPQPGTTLSTDRNITTVTAAAKTTFNQALGTASAKLEASTMNSLLAKAAEAETAGNGAVIDIKIEAGTAANAVEVEIPGNSFKEIAENTRAEIRIDAGIGTITFDDKAVDAVNSAANAGNINISIAQLKASDLTEEIREKVGDRPVFNFSVMAGEKEISQFGGGNAGISIPYTLKPGENKNSIIVYYVDSEGDLKTVRGRYDSETGKVTFTTSHFSKYVIGYNEVVFKDVPESAWYKDAVDFISARGIASGTGNGNYSPEGKLTRGQFAVMVLRAYDIEPIENPAANFADAGRTYYTNYLAAAKKLGISKGVGNNMYAPEKEITRQEMFTLLYNTLNVIGELPEATTWKSLTDYSDSEEIASWARDAMELFVKAGIADGSSGKLSPSDISNRIQMTQVLYKLLSR